LAAQKSLDQTMARINAQDFVAGQLVLQRLNNALDVIATQPAIGTPTERGNTRRFAIPKTGHSIDYTISRAGILVTRWARQRRDS